MFHFARHNMISKLLIFVLLVCVDTNLIGYHGYTSLKSKKAVSDTIFWTILLFKVD